MNKWPKEWIDVLDNPSLYRINGDANKFSYDWVHPQDILDRLHKAGALKDVPKLREIWWCPKCYASFKVMEPKPYANTTYYVHCDNEQLIKMREVADES